MRHSFLFASFLLTIPFLFGFCFYIYCILILSPLSSSHISMTTVHYILLVSSLFLLHRTTKDVSDFLFHQISTLPLVCSFFCVCVRERVIYIFIYFLFIHIFFFFNSTYWFFLGSCSLVQILYPLYLPQDFVVRCAHFLLAIPAVECRYLDTHLLAR